MAAEDLREAQEELSKLKKLIESPGFLWEQTVAQSDIEGRITRLVTTPPTSIEAVLGIVHELGVCAGIKKTVERPMLQIEVLEEEVERLADEEEENG